MPEEALNQWLGWSNTYYYIGAGYVHLYCFQGLGGGQEPPTLIMIECTVGANPRRWTTPTVSSEASSLIVSDKIGRITNNDTRHTHF
jgi:hypothetical protein